MSDDFQLNGQMQLFVYKQAAGLSGIACFLVDRGIVGLKDAWTRTDMSRNEFREMLEKCDRRGLRMGRVAIEEVRRWVAGGIRWAHENGMRLPKDWAKPASLIGGVGDWGSADLSGFAKEFAGHPEDLRQRLIGESFESLLAREDIDFIFSDAAPYMDQRTGQDAHVDDLNALDEGDSDLDDDPQSLLAGLPDEALNKQADRFIPAATALAADTAKWLEARTDNASPGLLEAWRSMMLAATLSKAAILDGPEDEVADLTYDFLKELSARIEPSRSTEHHRAVEQILEHLQTDPLLMQKAVLKYGLADQTVEERNELEMR